MISNKELLHGNKLLFLYDIEHKVLSVPYKMTWNKLISTYTLDDFTTTHCRYDESWDLLHDIIDKINAKGKQYNFVIFKTYLAMSVEKDSKYFKDFHFAHSEYITSEQTGKEAAFKLLVKYLEWESNIKSFIS